MKRQLALICIILWIGISGCTSLKMAYQSIFGTEEEQTAQELAWNGMDEYESGNYKASIETFKKLKDFYPFSKYAMLAELKIGDAHYQLEAYEEAIFAYEEFENLHPRNEAIPYVIYQIGRCYFDQIHTIDRDQTSARKALETFQRLQKQFPDDQYARRAEELIHKCSKSLAGNEFYIGRFYYKTKHYKAALQRFQTVLAKYPDVGYHQEALHYIAKCEEALAAEQK
ncbi:MAG: outer membrane protein assembly factor BamD [Desulfobacterales bacterium]|nr:MAG: outer membrane protein assembly factor BamD [Desulfobacterales bacterium]